MFYLIKEVFYFLLKYLLWEIVCDKSWEKGFYFEYENSWSINDILNNCILFLFKSCLFCIDMLCRVVLYGKFNKMIKILECFWLYMFRFFRVKKKEWCIGVMRNKIIWINKWFDRLVRKVFFGVCYDLFYWFKCK